MRPSDTHRLPTKILYDTSILERIIHMNFSDYYISYDFPHQQYQ